jgi:hypothetical protein
MLCLLLWLVAVPRVMIDTFQMVPDDARLQAGGRRRGSNSKGMLACDACCSGTARVSKHVTVAFRMLPARGNQSCKQQIVSPM